MNRRFDFWIIFIRTDRPFGDWIQNAELFDRCGTSIGQKRERDPTRFAECGNGFGTIAVRVNGAIVKTISLQAPSTHCGVLVPVKTYPTAAKRDVDIVVEKSGKYGVFVDGVGVSAA